MSATAEDQKVIEAAPGGLADIDPEGEDGAAPRTWTFKDGDETFTYVQKPLSFRAKLEFTGLLGRTMDDLMRGEDGLTLDGILGGGPSAEDLQRALATGGAQALAEVAAASVGGMDDFIRAIVRVAGYSDTFWDQCVCIWLRVPHDQRADFVDRTARPVDEGGLSDDEGFGILQTFVAQNWEDTERFFVERLRALRAQITTIRKATGLSQDDDSEPSKPSKRTRGRTQSR